MLSFFTDPYLDELLYSAFARYHFYSGNIDLKDTLTELFGKNSVIPSFEIGNYLQYLCSKLSKEYTPEGLIKEHTLFPFYSPFLPDDRKAEIIKDIIWADGQGVYTKIGIVAGAICKKDAIYYCSVCAKDDIERFGEPYIHREHQLQGVKVCPHHGRYLKKYTIKPQDRSRIEYIRLEEAMLDLSDIYLYQEKHFDKLLQIAQAAYYLLTNDLSNISKTDILCRYKNLLYEKELVTSNLRVRQEELHDLVINHYGVELLDILESGIDRNDEYNWLRVATRDVARTVHPLRHILLILFLVGDMDTFFKGIRNKYNPFGIGPWPCLNSAAVHYRQDVITNVLITADFKKRKPVGTFTCACGYSYSRTGPDHSDKDRYRKGRVKAFGYIWENELLDLLTEKNLSYRKMALYMGCDVKTIQKFESIFAEKPAAKGDIESVKPSELEEMHESYKNRLLSLVTEQPHLSRTEIRQLYKKEYAFLYRHDRAYLFGILPSAKQSGGSKGYIDWQQRDQELLSKLKKARVELLNIEKPTRISKTSLGKKIGQLSLLEKYLDKLPCCNEFIANASETTQQFQLRRCQKVIINMQQAGLPLIEWKIWRQAGLKKEDYNLIKDKLEWILHESSEGIQYG